MGLSPALLETREARIGPRFNSSRLGQPSSEDGGQNGAYPGDHGLVKAMAEPGQSRRPGAKAAIFPSSLEKK